MLQRILVTGSNGLLGQKLTDLFLQNPDKYIYCATGKGINRHPVEKGYQYIDLDVLDPNQVESVFAEFKPDFVIHTAAMTNVDACEEHPDLCHLLNVTSLEYLIRNCERYESHLIHLSTDFIFDGLNGPYRENDFPNPLSLYGQSKLDSERILQESTISWTILRTILVYGIVADMSRSNFVLWAKQSLEKGDPIRVVNDQWRMPTLAEDLAQACFLGIEHKKKGIFHISGSSGGTIFELVGEVAKFWGLNEDLISEITTSSLTQKAERPAKTGFDLSKAIQELHYQPRTFREGLAILDQQLKNRQK